MHNQEQNAKRTKEVVLAGRFFTSYDVENITAEQKSRSLQFWLQNPLETLI